MDMKADESRALREYFDAILRERELRYEHRFESLEKSAISAVASLEKQLNAAHAAAKEAIDKADASLEKWQSGANEWRGAMTDREREFVRRNEYVAAHEVLKSKIEKLESSSERSSGQSSGVHGFWLVLVGAVLVVATVTNIVISLSR